jgi:hypothetical protein
MSIWARRARGALRIALLATSALVVEAGKRWM